MTTLRTNKGRDRHIMADTATPSTSRGSERQAQTLTGCTKAELVSGDLTWRAAHGGSWANKVRIVHRTGDTGPGYESRPLDVMADVEDETVTVTFGTDVAGASVVPTPAQIVTEADVTPDLDKLADAVAGGATPASVLNTKLTGGVDDGDWLRIGIYVVGINTVE